MALLGHSRTNAIPIIGKIPIDSEFTDEEYENASNYYDDNRHFLARVAINTSIILSIMVSLSASLRMWNLDRSNGQNLRPNNYVLMTFGFSLLCLIFMVLINLFYTRILEATKAKPLLSSFHPAPKHETHS